MLSCAQAKGFELTYLEKVPEVKDTVHKQSLLHHVCSVVVENFPQSTDLYSEIGAITRSAKVRYPQTHSSSLSRGGRKICGAVRRPLISPSLMSGGFRPAAGESMSDGATLQSLLGPPEGHCQARDEAPAQAEDVRLPERLRREDHHPQNCSPQDYQQVGFQDPTVRRSLETLPNTFYVRGVPPGSTPSCCTSATRPTA